MAHCCAQKVMQPAIFGYINVPRTQFFSPAEHCWTEILGTEAILSHINALLTHIVYEWCTKRVHHVRQQCILHQQVCTIRSQRTALSHRVFMKYTARAKPFCRPEGCNEISKKTMGRQTGSKEVKVVTYHVL